MSATAEHTITVAVAGNPNAGKSTLINAIAGSRLQVGNWPGVTVEKKEAQFEFEGSRIRLVDLPGTYSLSPYTQEEIIARDYLVREKPDLVINVVDATNLERNLYLTMQLLELGLPVVMALNIYDEAEAKGYRIDVNGIERMLGIAVVPTAATKGRGTKELLEAALRTAGAPATRRIKPPKYDADIERAIDSVAEIIRKSHPALATTYPFRPHRPPSSPRHPDLPGHNVACLQTHV
jgi:ferrous iron transport protein B